MHHSRPLSIIFSAFLVVGYTAGSLSLNHVPLGVNVAQGFEGSEGGSSGGGGSTGGSAGEGGGSHNGGHRGHTTNVSRVVIRFLVQIHQIGTEQVGAFGGSDVVPLVEKEKDFLCSLQRYFDRLGNNEAINMHVVAEISRAMNRTEDFVESFLRNPFSCR